MDRVSSLIPTSRVVQRGPALFREASMIVNDNPFANCKAEKLTAPLLHGMRIVSITPAEPKRSYQERVRAAMVEREEAEQNELLQTADYAALAGPAIG
jgi:hypothetical protein